MWLNSIIFLIFLGPISNFKWCTPTYFYLECKLCDISPDLLGCTTWRTLWGVVRDSTIRFHRINQNRAAVSNCTPPVPSLFYDYKIYTGRLFTLFEGQGIVLVLKSCGARGRLRLRQNKNGTLALRRIFDTHKLVKSHTDVVQCTCSTLAALNRMYVTPQTPKCHQNLGAAEVVVTFGSLWCHSHGRKRGIKFYFYHGTTK